jgi:hypothetical protein
MGQGSERSVYAIRTPTSTSALLERAGSGDVEAAAEVIRRLAAGDVTLSERLRQPGAAGPSRTRAALVGYLAVGTWLGHGLPLSLGYRAGQQARQLRADIASALCVEPSVAWRTTLLDALHATDPLIRRSAATLLSACPSTEVLTALVDALADPDEGARWAAALALTHGGLHATELILQQLAGPRLVPEMRYVAAYVLRRTPDLTVRMTVDPVVHALESGIYRIDAPQAAEAALRALALSPPPGS